MTGRLSRRRFLGVASGTLALAGCSLLENENRVTSGSGGGGTPFAELSVPATDATTTATPARIDGSGSNRVGSVSVTEGTGTAEIRGRETPALVYRRIPWLGQTGRILYQTLAVSPDALYTVWFYGDGGGNLREAWVAGTDGTRLRQESASGTCEGTFDPTEVQMSFPATDLALTSLAGGYSVSGANVDIGTDGMGTVTLPKAIPEALATTYDAYAFESVDCTTRCGGSGWYELHLVLWNPAATRALFGIMYLPRSDDPVRLSYLLSLPDLRQPGQQQFDAEWSAP